MAVSHRPSLFFTVVLLLSITFLVSHEYQPQLVAAARPLAGEEQYWMKEKEKEEDGRQGFQSLQRGPVPPSGRNPCTNIPGQGSGVCTLNGKNFAGRLALAPPAFPSLVMEVGVAVAAS